MKTCILYCTSRLLVGSLKKKLERQELAAMALLFVFAVYESFSLLVKNGV